jgi:hypothetical protein
LIWQGDVYIGRNIVYLECVMQQSTAKLFANGDSQAVRLPEQLGIVPPDFPQACERSEQLQEPVEGWKE